MYINIRSSLVTDNETHARTQIKRNEVLKFQFGIASLRMQDKYCIVLMIIFESPLVSLKIPPSFHT